MKPLTNLPTFDADDHVNVIIETPKGSRNKYAYDPEIGTFRFKAVLPEGSLFPFDFGFIPSTLGEDGDPLDILVLLDAPIAMGCLLTVRLLGVIEAEQREQDDKVERNDRLLGVAVQARTHADLEHIDQLRSGFVEEVEGFFAHYNALSGRRFTPLRRSGPERARELVAIGARAASA
ncbi:inorganic diphosphatase [Methylobacterium sp. M6A4_1b]